MGSQLTIGKQIKLARQQKKLSQQELASKCNLNIRTIQRIENDEVDPRPYTLRIISEVLEVSFMRNNEEAEQKELIRLRGVFERRKQIRIFTFIVIIVLLASALLLLLSGIPKRTWAPFIYLFFFIDLIVIGFTWRCPGCNSLLEDVFNQKYCSKCGLKFYDDEQDQ